MKKKIFSKPKTSRIELTYIVHSQTEERTSLFIELASSRPFQKGNEWKVWDSVFLVKRCIPWNKIQTKYSDMMQSRLKTKLGQTDDKVFHICKVHCTKQRANSFFLNIQKSFNGHDSKVFSKKNVIGLQSHKLGRQWTNYIVTFQNMISPVSYFDKIASIYTGYTFCYI